MTFRPVAVSLAIAVALSAGGAAPAEEAPVGGAAVDLTGTWFVLIHYRDEATANPDLDRWEDKVWVFESKASRLHWTEYPIVVFRNPTGRFEARAGNRRARVLDKWEPDEGQRLEILDGPRVNSRGSKTKSLRKSAEGGFESVGGLRAQSASVIGYYERWSIAEPASRPVFTRDDILGSGGIGGRAEGMEGRTQYQTTAVEDGGATLRGIYARDENRRGTFRMIRAGSVRGLESDGRTPNEKAADRAREQVLDEVRRRLDEGDPELIRELREQRRQGR